MHVKRTADTHNWDERSSKRQRLMHQSVPLSNILCAEESHSTPGDETVVKSTPESASLLGLPLELRTFILEELLVNNKPLGGYRRQPAINENGVCTSPPRTGNFSFHPQILRTCTQLRDEGYELLYGSNVFELFMQCSPQPYAGVLGYPYVSFWPTPEDQVVCANSLKTRVRNYDISIGTDAETDAELVRETIRKFCHEIGNHAIDELRITIDMFEVWPRPYDYRELGPLTRFYRYDKPRVLELLMEDWLDDSRLMCRMRMLILAHEALGGFQAMDIYDLKVRDIPEALAARIRDVILNGACPFSPHEMSDIANEDLLRGERDLGRDDYTFYLPDPEDRYLFYWHLCLLD